MNFDTISDFIIYLGAYFSGGNNYRQEWRIWHNEDIFDFSEIKEESEGKQENKSLVDLEVNIEKENKHIKDRLDSVLIENHPVDDIATKPLKLNVGEQPEVQQTVVLNELSSSKAIKKEYYDLLDRLAFIIRELDGYQQRLETEEAKSIIDITSLHLIEAMESGNVEEISNDTFFNILYHTPIPTMAVENGTPIIETIRPGLKIGNKVIVRAQVKIS